MSKPFIQFPPDFLFGVATAAYQIEGAAKEDGRGPSIWDTFSHTPGKVHEGQTGDIACDHYHLYPQDVALMKELGIPAYRFSIAWPRIFPEAGRFNQKGIDFYRRLLETLHENDIKPSATLYHWDLPQWIGDKGGWINRDTANYFAEYADKVYEQLGDLIPTVITHNEPWCASFLSYALGHHAPGHTDWREGFVSAHHILLSHAMAVEAYRASGKSGDIGITLNFTWQDPASDAPADVAAAYRKDGFTNRWFVDALFKGEYPEDCRVFAEERVGSFDFVKAGDLDRITTPIDFLGVNFYTRDVSAADVNDPGLGARTIPAPADKVTDMGWEIHPESLYRLLKWLEADYTKGLPLYITENGAAFKDQLVDGEVHDADRIAYVADHLKAAKRFVDEGGSLQGYYLWSFLDNFEWAFGYDKRFGMVYVDYDTQVRTVKDSGQWYSRQIAFNQGTERA